MRGEAGSVALDEYGQMHIVSDYDMMQRQQLL